MKYFLRVIIVLVVAVGVVCGVYYYTNPDEFSDNQVSLTTVTKAPATEKDSDRQLLASIEKENIYLYKSDKKVILSQNNKEYEFDNWSSMIDAQPPEIYYADFDSDKQKEILVKAVNEKDSESGEYIYNIYLLKSKQDADGNDTYSVIMASRNTVNDILDKYITEEISQLKSCKKIVQFAMNNAGKSIEYDKNTGLSKSKHTGYFKALQDSNGQYLTVSKWSKGINTFTITDDNKIEADIAIDVSYEDSSAVQNAGQIRFEITLNSENSFIPSAKSLYFDTNSEYKVSDPTTTSSTVWSYAESNSDKSNATSDTTIDWIKYTTKYDSTISTQALNYSTEETDIKLISKVVVANNYIELTAKDGCSFDANSAKKGDFSVIINSGTDDEYDIAYTAKITTTGSNEVLKITFDKSYPKDEINTIDINFGAK